MVPDRSRAASPFDAMEAGSFTKEEFRSREKSLRVELLALQAELREADFPVLLLFCGVDAAGKGETANLFLEWMDPRGIATCAYGPPTTEEAERPWFWRFWRDLPANGDMGIFLSAWYHDPLLDHVHGDIDDGVLERRLEQIRNFEQTLTDEGALILKFWMHLGKEDQRGRLSALEADPLLSWRVTDTDWMHWRMYDRFIGTAERIISRTDAAAAPWTIVDGRERGWRSVQIGEALRDRVREHMSRDEKSKAATDGTPESAPPATDGHETGPLNARGLERPLQKSEYRRELVQLQARLNLLYRRAREEGISTVLVFEGWDASGKGGSIRRITPALDARGYRVLPIAAPNDDERAHHYLWRFWQHLPRAGSVTIFDRSWYGRVLVERVEGYASEEEWSRAYREINDFEQQLVEHGMVLVKFWMHISRDEQKVRFKRRQSTPYKAWKLTEEDWRNRQRWKEYEQAIRDMVDLTRDAAGWTLVEGDDKRYARIKVLRTLCAALEEVLGEQPPP